MPCTRFPGTSRSAPAPRCRNMAEKKRYPPVMIETPTAQEMMKGVYDFFVDQHARNSFAEKNATAALITKVAGAYTMYPERISAKAEPIPAAAAP